MINALGMSKGTGGGKAGDRLASFVGGKILNPYISNDLAEVIENPIKFRTERGGIA